jgi:hypothetical protein
MHKRMGLFVGLLLVTPRIASAQDVVNLWQARFATARGETRCAYGASDCNRCVYDVQGQFKKMTIDGAMDRRAADWTFTPGNYYAPKGTLPSSTFDYVDVALSDLGLTGTPPNIDVHDFGHFQSFARLPTTADNEIAYVTAFDGKNGSLFGTTAKRMSGVDEGRLSNATLSYMDGARTVHIGGMQGIGRRALIAQETPGGGPATLSFYDFTYPSAPSALHTDLRAVSGQNSAANVGVVKLASGGYFIVSSEGSYHQNYRVYYTPSLSAPRLEPIYRPSVVYPSAPSRSGTKDGFENVSLVTECGTGDVYMVGVTGPDMFGGMAISTATYGAVDSGYGAAKGTWSLYKLTNPISAELVATNAVDMDRASCDPRGGGSAFAGQHGELVFYCTAIARASSIREAACPAALAASGGGGLLAGLLNLLTPLVGLPPMGDLLGGTLGVVSPFLAGVECGGAMVDSLQNNDGRWGTAFTEWWPRAATPETPTVQTYPVTFAVSSSLDGWKLAVKDGVSSHQCTVITNGSGRTTCTINVPAGKPATFYPVGPEPSAGFYFTGNPSCPVGDLNTQSCVCDTRGATCTVKAVTGPMTFNMYAGVLL